LSRILAVELREIRLPLVRPFRTSFGTERDKRVILAKVEIDLLPGRPPALVHLAVEVAVAVDMWRRVRATEHVQHVMGAGGVFIALLEYGPVYRGQRTFRVMAAPPQLEAGDFAYNTVQIFVPGQLGLQQFFEFDAHTFCLYVVVGSQDAIGAVLPTVNELVGSLTVT
jgi:hypothetical protein